MTAGDEIMSRETRRSIAASALLALGVAGCGGSSDSDGPSVFDPGPTGGTPTVPETPGGTEMPAPGGEPDAVARRYEVSVTNLTGGQTFSEPALILHPATDAFWSIGQPASEALERLAEAGESDALATLADAEDYPFVGGESTVAPGNELTFTIVTRTDAETALTVLTRLQSTDDGFTGINALDLSTLTETGQSMTVDRWALDSGTEKNLESTNLGSFGASRPSTPSEVAGSEFNRVLVHPGVISEIESTPDNTSQLNRSRRFDNPVVRIRVTRIEG